MREERACGGGAKLDLSPITRLRKELYRYWCKTIGTGMRHQVRCLGVGKQGVLGVMDSLERVPAREITEKHRRGGT